MLKIKHSITDFKQRWQTAVLPSLVSSHFFLRALQVKQFLFDLIFLIVRVWLLFVVMSPYAYSWEIFDCPSGLEENREEKGSFFSLANWAYCTISDKRVVGCGAIRSVHSACVYLRETVGSRIRNETPTEGIASSTSKNIRYNCGEKVWYLKYNFAVLEAYIWRTA